MGCNGPAATDTPAGAPTLLMGCGKATGGERPRFGHLRAVFARTPACARNGLGGACCCAPLPGPAISREGLDYWWAVAHGLARGLPHQRATVPRGVPGEWAGSGRGRPGARRLVVAPGQPAIFWALEMAF